MICCRSPPNDEKKRLSDLMSPSELLEDALDIDDIEEAMDEASSSKLQSEEEERLPMVKGIKEELEKVLEQVVKATANVPLHKLLDLHYQFSRIARNYMRTHNRKYLPTVSCSIVFILRYNYEGHPIKTQVLFPFCWLLSGPRIYVYVKNSSE